MPQKLTDFIQPKEPPTIPVSIKEEKVVMVDGKPFRTMTMETTQPITKEIITKEIDILQKQIELLTQKIAEKKNQLEIIK